MFESYMIPQLKSQTKRIDVRQFHFTPEEFRSAYRGMLNVHPELFYVSGGYSYYHSDGFIVSTPTGSTAYSLSAGGPILDPSLRGVALTPICPHSLHNRPIIVPEESEIEIRYLSPSEVTAHLTVDGEEAAELVYDDSVRICQSPLITKLIRLKRERVKSFYDILRDKMSEIGSPHLRTKG